MALYRTVQIDIWQNPDFFSLTADEKLVFFNLFTSSQTRMCGMYEITPQMRAMETGVTYERYMEVINKLQRAGKIVYADNVVWVVNFQKHQNYAGEKNQARIDAEFASTPDGAVKTAYAQYYGIDYEPTTGVELIPHQYPMHRVSTATVTVTATESELATAEELLSASADARTPEPPTDRYPIEDFLYEWRRWFPDKPQPRHTSKTIVAKWRARCREPMFCDNWRAALERGSTSEFLNTGGWFDAVWFLKNDTNWEKVNNGNYDNKTAGERPGQNTNGNGKGYGMDAARPAPTSIKEYLEMR
jgi:hypothetical protein